MALILVTAGLVVFSLGAGAETTPIPRDTAPGQDIRYEPGGSTSLTPAANDTLGLLRQVDIIRQNSIGVDRLEVWACGVDETPQEIISFLEEEVRPWFEFHSRGRYNLEFVVGGSHDSGDGWECGSHASTASSGDNHGAILVNTGYPGPAATPGCDLVCGSRYPDNGRDAHIPGGQRPSTWAHEIGHMLHWPHTFTDTLPTDDYTREYDYPLDLMSGNRGVWEDGGYTQFGSYPEPFDTAAVNRYAAGWMRDSEVHVFDGAGVRLPLTNAGGSGYQMAVIERSDSYLTLSARPGGAHDPILDHWTGVEVMEVELCDEGTLCDIGFRATRPQPPTPFEWPIFENYADPLPQIIRPGQTITLGGVRVAVVGTVESGYSVEIGPDPVDLPAPDLSAPWPERQDADEPIDPVLDPSAFFDTGGHVFEDDIEWLAGSGITRGCNPPDNTLFCPDDPVTRGQMAAFLTRALGLTVPGPSFTDTTGHVFEADIARLAQAGITRGCNPPVNDRFCPNDAVTRGQMAAFLTRALHLTASGPTFDDTNGHVFEADISRLAQAGITRGCNPPVNDRFCPDHPVTRGQMGAFLHRALGN